MIESPFHHMEAQFKEKNHLRGRETRASEQLEY